MAFNPAATYNTVVDADGKVYTLQSGIYYDAQGNTWTSLPPSKNGYAAVSSVGVNPQSIVLAGTPATLTNPAFQVTNSVDNYTQISIQNKSATVNSSADVVAYPDNVSASDLTGFMDMGITSSAYAQAAYAVTGANEGYLFMSAVSGSGKSGDMVLATDATGTTNAIRFYTGGFDLTNRLRMKITSTGVTFVTGVTLTNLMMSTTAPTVSGFGTSPSVVSNNGTAAFTINVGTGGTASTGTITLPAAATGWVLTGCHDVTTPGSFITRQTGGTSTTITVTNYSATTGLAIAWTASDILRCAAIAY